MTCRASVSVPCRPVENSAIVVAALLVEWMIDWKLDDASAARFMNVFALSTAERMLSGSTAETIWLISTIRPSSRSERPVIVFDISVTLARKSLIPSAFSASAPVNF